MDKYFTDIRNGAFIAEPLALVRTEDPMSAIQALRQYTEDSTAIIRYRAYRLVSRIALRNVAPDTRGLGIAIHTVGCQDEDAGVVRQNLYALTSYNLSDFDEESKTKLVEVYGQSTFHKPLFSKLIGFLGDNSALSILTIQSAEGTQANRWAALLAMTRMGDEGALDYVLGKVKGFPVNDDLVYDLLPDLAYARQKTIFNYLFEIISRDEENCSVADPEMKGKINCAYRVLELVAPYVKDFPVKTDESGDLDVKDYRKALATSRDWISKNMPQYQLISEVF